MRSAGGFSGEMPTGGAAQFGSVSLLGLLDLGLGDLLKAVEVFVPVVKKASVSGYRSGVNVEAFGTAYQMGQGNAGGFAGVVIGGKFGERRSLLVRRMQCVLSKVEMQLADLSERSIRDPLQM